MIFVFTKKAASLKTVFPKNTEFTSLALSKHSPSTSDITYIDISGLTSAEIKKTLIQAKKSCNNSPWGIIDPKGSVKDCASLFFEGASDYLGPAFLKGSKGIDVKRLKETLQWRRALAGTTVSSDDDKSVSAAGGFLNSGVKLPPASTFPGWKKMQAGKSMPFYLLFCSLQGKTALESRLGEKVLAQIHKRFISLLVSNFKGSEGLLWMDSGKDCLILLPPRAKSVEISIKACMKMIVGAPLYVLETLGLSIPANFVFALHYGTISYKPPGRTGTVVSDAVYSIFHLGAKKSEPGRLTISGALPDVSIPKSCQDLFASHGEYEGRKIWHTKKFNYAKAWF